MPITHRERLETTINGDHPDRPPISLWRHFPVDDQHPDTLAKAMIAFQNQFDFDFVKVMPPSSFCLKKWGAEDEWQGNPEGTRTYTKRVITHPEDWYKLKPLNPFEGALGDQLKCLAHLQNAFKEHTPFIQTIFNPLSQAKNLVGPEHLSAHLRLFPEALHHGLKTIQETTIRFIEAATQFGISGIFYAIQHASYQLLSDAEYLEFGSKYDIPILKAVNSLWANMVHLHGTDIMFDLVANYPVQIINWPDRETSPNISEGLSRFKGTVCGGIDRINSFLLGTPNRIIQEARQTFEQTDGKRIILSTGCSLPLTTPYGNIKAARDVVEAFI